MSSQQKYIHQEENLTNVKLNRILTEQISFYQLVQCHQQYSPTYHNFPLERDCLTPARGKIVEPRVHLSVVIVALKLD